MVILSCREQMKQRRRQLRQKPNQNQANHLKLKLNQSRLKKFKAKCHCQCYLNKPFSTWNGKRDRSFIRTTSTNTTLVQCSITKSLATSKDFLPVINNLIMLSFTTHTKLVFIQQGYTTITFMAPTLATRRRIHNIPTLLDLACQFSATVQRLFKPNRLQEPKAPLKDTR